MSHFEKYYNSCLKHSIDDEWEPGPSSFTDVDKGVKKNHLGGMLITTNGCCHLLPWSLSSRMAPLNQTWKGVNPVGEDGDPCWDEERFGEPGYCDVYNVLLVRPVGDGLSERVGSGRMNFTD